MPACGLKRISMNNARRIILGLCTLATFMALGSGRPVHAFIVNVDYGEAFLYSGQGALGSGGNFWNYGDLNLATSQTHTDLLDSSGAATSVDATVTSDIPFSGGNASPPGYVNSLTEDYTSLTPYSRASFYRLTISDLAPSLTYKLILYGYMAFTTGSTGLGTAFTINGVTKTTDGDFNVAKTGFVEGTTHAIFTNLSPNSSNQIVVDMAPEEADIAMLNGWQLQAVPLPPAIVLLASGIAVLIGFGWIHKKRFHARHPEDKLSEREWILI